MIRIIKKGIEIKKYKTIYSATCYKCKCEFEFEEEDCGTILREKRLNGKVTALINCPCCNSPVISHNLRECNSRQEEVCDPWDNEHCNECNSKNQIGDACSFCPHSPYKVTCNNEVK